jgi:hypothetical protein
MANVRMLALADSGKAILRFRNGLDGPVTITPLLAGMEEKKGDWRPLVTPFKLKAGETHNSDVSDPIQQLFPPVGGTDPHQMRMRIRMLLDPGHLGEPREVECVATFHSGKCTEFVCH